MRGIIRARQIGYPLYGMYGGFRLDSKMAKPHICGLLTPTALEESLSAHRVADATHSGAEVTESSLPPFRWGRTVIRIVSSAAEPIGRSLRKRLVRWYKERKGNMATATPSAPAAAEVDDPLNIVLDEGESEGVNRMMEKSERPNPGKAARHADAAHFAKHLKETGQLPA